VAIALASLAASSLARGEPSPLPGHVLPAGLTWWCIERPGATGACARTRPLCEARIASMEWGGTVPRCVQQGQAYCSSYITGPRSAPVARWLCNRDPAGCAAARAAERRAHRHPEIFTATACRPVR
jgi:hypothetical protein